MKADAVAPMPRASPDALVWLTAQGQVVQQSKGVPAALAAA